MSYRKLKIQKRVGGKLRRYKNLATFNKECSTRGRTHSESVICDLTNARKLRDGSGMATVRAIPLTSAGVRKRGTWLLHFADYGVMKRHLKNRITMSTHGPGGKPIHLDGPKRRRRRR